MPSVELPAAEAMAVAFARTVLPSTTVGTKVRKPRPVRYARVWRTGGGALNRAVERAQITVTCGATDALVASADASALRKAFLNDYTRMPLVRGVEEVTGLHYDPDPDTGEDRYTFTVALTIRGKR